MSVSEQISALAKKINAMKSSIETEEATKNAFIMPFISNVLGYDVFDPSEVVPEFTADVGVKKGEKVDYAILHNGEVQILIECKPIGAPLDLKHASQLFRYFAVTSARIAVLTNGQTYQVYTDGDMPNRMDEKPFLVLDLLDLDRSLLPEVQKLSKESFDLDSVINAAQELKYVGGIRRAIAAEVKDSTDEWVRYFVAKVYDGKATQRVLEQFRPLVSQALNQYINAQVNERLKTALGEDSAAESEAPVVRAEVSEPSVVDGRIEADPDIVTTDEELEGFNIVRAIAVSEVAPERITYRDSKTYFAILLDDNNRKPVIRLYFNGKNVKYVMTFEQGSKDPKRFDIESVVDIYQVADQIRQAVKAYEA